MNLYPVLTLFKFGGSAYRNPSDSCVQHRYIRNKPWDRKHQESRDEECHYQLDLLQHHIDSSSPTTVSLPHVRCRTRHQKNVSDGATSSNNQQWKGSNEILSWCYIILVAQHNHCTWSSVNLAQVPLHLSRENMAKVASHQVSSDRIDRPILVHGDHRFWSDFPCHICGKLCLLARMFLFSEINHFASLAGLAVWPVFSLELFFSKFNAVYVAQGGQGLGTHEIHLRRPGDQTPASWGYASIFLIS